MLTNFRTKYFFFNSYTNLNSTYYFFNILKAKESLRVVPVTVGKHEEHTNEISDFRSQPPGLR